MQRLIWLFSVLAVIALAAGVAAQPPIEAADALDLLPTPREMTLTGDRWPTEGWSISASGEAVLAQTGAREVNDRIVSVGGEDLPVRQDLGAGNTILIAPCTDPLAADVAAELKVSPADPGEQAM